MAATTERSIPMPAWNEREGIPVILAGTETHAAAARGKRETGGLTMGDGRNDATHTVARAGAVAGAEGRRSPRGQGKVRAASTSLAALLVLGGLLYWFHQRLLPHFHTVQHGVLYRSGQPRSLGLRAVQAHGIRTVINLRAADSDGVQAERDFCARHGLRFLSIPIGTTTEEIAAVVQEFLAVMKDKSNHPVLVHCSRGKERSGILSAVFRMECDGWSNQKALHEMQSLGLDPGSMPVAEAFVWNYRPILRREPVAGGTEWKEQRR